jgi:hypothetical protein
MWTKEISASWGNRIKKSYQIKHKPSIIWEEVWPFQQIIGRSRRGRTDFWTTLYIGEGVFLQCCWNDQTLPGPSIQLASVSLVNDIRTTRNLWSLGANNSTFVHLRILWKESKCFRRQDAYAKFFCQLRYLCCDFWYQMPDSMILDLLMIKTKSYGPRLRELKSA